MKKLFLPAFIVRTPEAHEKRMINERLNNFIKVRNVLSDENMNDIFEQLQKISFC